MASPKTRKIPDEIWDDLLNQMAEGKSLRSICKAENMPARKTVFERLKHDEVFRKQYELAQELQAEWWFDEMTEIADDGSNDTYFVQTDQGSVAKQNHEWTGRSKLRVETRRWNLSKMLPKKYGEKLQHTGDGGGEIKVAVNVGVKEPPKKNADD